MFRPTFWQVTVDRAHARTHPESRDLITRLLDVIASLTATIRRTDQGQGDWLDDLNRENPR